MRNIELLRYLFAFTVVFVHMCYFSASRYWLLLIEKLYHSFILSKVIFAYRKDAVELSMFLNVE